MNVATVAGVLRERARLRAHEDWTREALMVHQARCLANLRAFAVSRSPFYRDLHRGLDEAPLEALPVVTKATLMERFDDLVTDRDISLAAVEAFTTTSAATDRFRGRYRVAATGGTTGRRGVFLSDPHEWTEVLASYARAHEWAGVAAGLTNRVRMAVISSTNPAHQSSIVGATVASRFVPTLRLDATTPLEEIDAALNAFRPDTLVGYVSVLRVLAEEQAAGRLRVAPQAVMSASEVLTPDTRERIRAAFGVSATNVLAAAIGQPDDLPFSVLAGIEGREEDVLSLGGVTVFPNVFHSALERLPVAGWQVIDEGSRLHVLLAGGNAIDTATTAESVRRALARVGVVDVPVQVDLVDAIPRTALGKAPLVRRQALAVAI